jgi:hypothetical protein
LLIIFTFQEVNVCSKLSKDTLRYEITYDYLYQVNKEDTLSKREQMALYVAKDFSYYKFKSKEIA